MHAVLLLTRPGATLDTAIADLLPEVQLFVHVYGGSAGTSAGTTAPETEFDPETGAVERIARVEKHGLVTEAWVRNVLGPRARFKIRPVLDLGGQAPVDAYEIPDRHRRAVHLIRRPTPSPSPPACLARSRSTTPSLTMTTACPGWGTTAR